MTRLNILLTILCVLLIARAQADEELEENMEADEDQADGDSLEVPSELVAARTLPKQTRDSFNFVQQPRTRRPVVRQNIYNFYNVRPPMDQQQVPRPNYQPNYNNYAPNNQYYQQDQPNYPIYPNYYQQQQLQQPQQQQQQQQQLPPTADPTKPIGYMLINRYRSPLGSISRPVAFFKT